LKRFAYALTTLAAFAIGTSLFADEPTEPSDDLIHSDVPLWGFEHEDIWPQHFSSDDGSFGCTSRVRFGDWQISSNAPDAGNRWLRLSNYGVFHCALIEQRAYDRDELSDAAYERGFAVKIGDTRQNNRNIELWVLQSGTRTGSDYTLLARERSDGVVERFIVLQRKCPAGKMRKGPNLDVWLTRYCSINSQAEMVSLARRMASLPPLATMQWVGDAIERPEAADKQD